MKVGYIKLQKITRPWFLASCILGISSSVFSQNLEPYFSQSFYDSSFTTVQQVIRSERGEYYAVLARDFYDSANVYTYTTVVEKRGPAGQLLNKITFTAFFGYGSQIIFAPDSGILLFNRNQLIKLDGDLNEGWTRDLDRLYTEISATHDENFLLAAHSSDTIFLRKVDSGAGEIWKNEIPDTTLQYINGIVKGLSNDFLILTDGPVVRVDSVGNFVSTNSFSIANPRNIFSDGSRYYLLSDTVVLADPDLNELGAIPVFNKRRANFSGAIYNGEVLISDGYSIASLSASGSIAWQDTFPQYEFHGAVALFAENQELSSFTLYYEGSDPSWMYTRFRNALTPVGLSSNSDLFFNTVQNPSDQSILIKYHIHQPQEVIVSVRDIRGNLIQEIFSGISSYGEHEIYLPKSGIYFAVLSTANKKVSRRIIISR